MEPFSIILSLREFDQWLSYILKGLYDKCETSNVFVSVSCSIITTGHSTRIEISQKWACTIISIKLHCAQLCSAYRVALERLQASRGFPNRSVLKHEYNSFHKHPVWYYPAGNTALSTIQSEFPLCYNSQNTHPLLSHMAFSVQYILTHTECNTVFLRTMHRATYSYSYHRPENHHRHGYTTTPAVDSLLVGCGGGCRDAESRSERGFSYFKFTFSSLYIHMFSSIFI